MTSNGQPAFGWHANKRHRPGCFSGGGKTRDFTPCARCAALPVIGLRAAKGHCTGGRPLAFVARPRCDVRAVTSNAEPALAWHTRARYCAGYLSGGGKTLELVARAPRAVPVINDARTAERYCTGGRPHIFGARPWCDVRAVASNTQPAFAWHMRARHCAGYHLGGGKSLKLAARARRAALATNGVCTAEGYCAGGRPLPFGAKLWCDVRAVTSNAQPAFASHCVGCLLGGCKTREVAARALCRADCD